MTETQRLSNAIRAIYPYKQLADDECMEVMGKAKERLEPQKDILQCQDYSFRLAGIIQNILIGMK
jgi:hypothetical protein